MYYLNTDLIKPQIKDYNNDIWAQSFKITPLDKYFPAIFALRFYGFKPKLKFHKLFNNGYNIVEGDPQHYILYHEYSKLTIQQKFQEALQTLEMPDKNNSPEDYQRSLVRLLVVLLSQGSKTISEEPNFKNYPLILGQYTLLYYFVNQSRYSNDFAKITQEEFLLEIDSIQKDFKQEITYIIEENISEHLDTLIYQFPPQNALSQPHFVGCQYVTIVQFNQNSKQNSMIERKVKPKLDLGWTDNSNFSYKQLFKTIDIEFWHLIRHRIPLITMPMNWSHLVFNSYYWQGVVRPFIISNFFSLHRSDKYDKCDNFLESCIHFDRAGDKILWKGAKEGDLWQLMFLIVIYDDDLQENSKSKKYIGYIESLVKKTKNMCVLEIIICLLLFDYQNVLNKQLKNTQKIKNIFLALLKYKINKLKSDIRKKFISSCVDTILNFNQEYASKKWFLIDKKCSKKVKLLLEETFSKSLTML